MADFKEATVITITAPTGGVTAGNLYSYGGVVVVAQATAAAAAKVAVAVPGGARYDNVPKEGSLVIAAGDVVYWDATNNRIDLTTTNVKCGFALNAAVSAATLVDIVLIPGIA